MAMFPNFDGTSSGKDGGSITDAESRDKATYPTFDFKYYKTWVAEGGTPFLRLYPVGIKFQDIPTGDKYPETDLTDSGKDGGSITDAESRDKATYPTFDFETVWIIINGIIRPELLEFYVKPESKHQLRIFANGKIYGVTLEEVTEETQLRINIENKTYGVKINE